MVSQFFTITLLSFAITIQLFFIPTLAAQNSLEVIYHSKDLPKIQKKILFNQTTDKTAILFFYSGMLQVAPELGLTQKTENIYIFNSPFGNQFLLPADHIDRELMKKSNVSKKPVEYLTVSAVLNETEYHFDDYYTEKKLNSISSDTIVMAVDQFMKKFEKKTGGRDLTYIRIAHSHPIFEGVLMPSGTISRKYLSKGDMQVAQMVSGITNVPVLITATLPNQYTYSAIFNGALNVTK